LCHYTKISGIPKLPEQLIKIRDLFPTVTEPGRFEIKVPCSGELFLALTTYDRSGRAREPKPA
jgi:hypothetical protein